MPAILPRRLALPAVRSPTARKWLKAGFVTIALLAGAGLVSHLVADRPTAGNAARRAALEQCAEGALLVHDVRWAAACMVLAEQDQAKRAACLEDPAIVGNPQLGVDHCNRVFSLRDGSAECELPDGSAASLYGLLLDAEQKCQAEAKAWKER